MSKYLSIRTQIMNDVFHSYPADGWDRLMLAGIIGFEGVPAGFEVQDNYKDKSFGELVQIVISQTWEKLSAKAA